MNTEPDNIERSFLCQELIASRSSPEEANCRVTVAHHDRRARALVDVVHPDPVGAEPPRAKREEVGRRSEVHAHRDLDLRYFQISARSRPRWLRTRGGRRRR